ncbi:NADH-quinone oxidoreductase subunit J [Cellulosimicrobium sp. CUA-896]|uniref:NADH-quinone oxidoreductase subunit J n=1 Tax=Cellulosimicrobium sp. CUA-896 TaxID=1517881 RepID=UPI000961C769|nr:NADH-quinone oxidoreductase subunit J [Cellulosimicrobium sp. CUA-896]OLT51709.1 NADH:ubiquinone oxidoreductase subunit J [Cellulosimicrobium sp. CUA-896]
MTGPVLLVVLGALGALAVCAGVLVFVVDSMARATFSLLASFLAVGASLLLLDLPYLGLLVVLMMTVEMAIMVVFMVMLMMNPGGLMPMSMVHNTRGAVAAGVVVLAALSAGIWTVDWPERSGAAPPDTTVQVGEAVMGPHMLVMIVVGVVLLATMIAGLALATPRGRYDRLGPDLDRPRPDDPVDGGLPR